VGGCDGRSLLRALALDILLVEIARHALLKTGDAVGEHRLAVAGQLLLGVEEVEHVGRVPAGHAAAARERAGQRDQDGGGNEALHRAHGRLLTQLVI
jgi:hypothetical protein